MRFNSSSSIRKRDQKDQAQSIRFSFIRSLFKTSEITFIIVSGVLFFFVLIFLHYFFMINTIHLKDLNGISMQNWYLEGLETIYGKSMLTTSSPSLEEVIRTANPAVESVTVRKVYPQTIDVLIRLQKPIGYFRYSPTRYFMLSSDGTLLKYEYEKPSNLGEIRYYQSVSPGEYALGKPMGSRDIRFAAQIAGILQKHNLKEYEISIQDSHLILCEVAGITIKTASDSDTARQLASLDQLLRITQKGGEKIKGVDVRFEKIIIEK